MNKRTILIGKSFTPLEVAKVILASVVQIDGSESYMKDFLDYEPDGRVGICESFEFFNRYQGRCSPLNIWLEADGLQRHFRTWSQYSGRESYPIPVTDEDLLKTQSMDAGIDNKYYERFKIKNHARTNLSNQYWLCHNFGTMWVGEQLELRISLLKHIISEEEKLCQPTLTSESTE